MYADEFEELARTHPNFQWHPALSEPRGEERWAGDVGFVHDVLERTLTWRTTWRPKSCEFYLCGPPLMARATIAMLVGSAWPADNIHFDDFGG